MLHKGNMAGAELRFLKLSFLCEANGPDDVAAAGRRARAHHDIAAQTFLEMLHRLRSAFLQDSVPWRQRHPTHFLWNHALFSDPEYLDFADRAQAAAISRAADVPHDIRSAMPRLCDLIDLANQSRSQQDHQTSATLAGHGDVQRKILESIVSINGHLKALHNDLARPRTISLDLPPVLFSTGLTDSADHALNAQETTQLSSADPSGAVAGQNANVCLEQPSSLPLAGSSVRLISEFSMSRSVKTVTDLWREYATGLSGRPSVRTMYETEKRHLTESESKYFRRRKVVLDLVESIAESRGIPCIEAAVAVESWRTQQSMSLNKMSLTIPKMQNEERLLCGSIGQRA